MILVADSGSTNTDWIVIEGNKVKSLFTTRGFNPYFTTSEKLNNELVSELPKYFDTNDFSKIYFYGSGCSSSEMKDLIHKGLKKIFINAHLEINHDLLGAARALFKNEKGIALILGTGANSCLYNGQKIEKNIPSLGFILGDEGGGDYLGKLFITELLYKNLPEGIISEFLQKYDLNENKIMQKIYKKEHPNQFFASICEFIYNKKENEFIVKLINKSFTDLFEKHVTKYKNYQNYKIRATGSVAYYFQDFLKSIASDFNATIDWIEKKPINKLVEYHINLI